MSFFTPYSLLSPEERARLPGPVGDGDAELDGVSWRGKYHDAEAEIREAADRAQLTPAAINLLRRVVEHFEATGEGLIVSLDDAVPTLCLRRITTFLLRQNSKMTSSLGTR